MKEERFIPKTMEREIAKDVVFRPIKSWHSLTYAGEKATVLPGSTDHSGCMRIIDNLPCCSIPYTVTHRLYWHRKNPDFTISAFLSYPGAMGAVDDYFWETLGTSSEDVERFSGDDAEKSMERKIIRVLKNKVKQKG